MKTLLHFTDFLNEINSSNSRLHKQSVLKKYADDEIVKRYLKIAFNPYVVYGISTKKLNKQILSESLYVPKAHSVFELFDYLEAHNTGTTSEILECQYWLNLVATDSIEYAKILEALICKRLSIGCDAKTINKEMPKLIPTFEVQLANKYFDKPEFVEGKDFAITTKIDGGRIIALKENGEVTFYTRAGQKYEGLVDLEYEMTELLPDGLCLDGEITLLDNKGIPSKEAYKQAMKITRADGEKHGVKMLVFDAMPASEFKAKRCDRSWTERRSALEFIFRDRDLEYFELLPVLYQGKDTEMILKWLDAAIADDQEGVMLNICEAPYEFKRTNYLLKCKKFDSLDLEVVGVEEGSGRLAGMLGAIQVRYKDGNIVRVGSGFSDAERKQYWANPELILNKVVEVKYFEETTNADKTFSLRFPTWCSNIRADKLTPDY